jgi:3-hydroxyisobutyrate dehydrogenase-like beta-hydroxyacid dehydrogenase
MRIGFIGTGHMGNPITRHLLKAGHEVTVFDKRQEAAANLIELGASWGDSPAAAADGAEVVFTSLPGPPEVDDAVLGENGALEGAKPGSVHVDLSSNLPSAVKRLSRIEGARGIDFLDAPLSGMTIGAEEGTLTIFVGGEEKTLERVRPLLDAFGKNIFHIGPVGSGNILKLTNNMMIHASSLLVQEALAIGVKAGIDAEKLYEIWNVSSSSRFVQGIPRLLERNFDNPSFTLALTAKDVGLCVEAAREMNVPTTVAAAASQVYVRSMARGLGDKLMSATLITIEEEAGVKIEKKAQ